MPVQPEKEPERRYEYYDFMSVIETDIEDDAGITIVFEPVISVEDELAERQLAYAAH